MVKSKDVANVTGMKLFLFSQVFSCFIFRPLLYCTIILTHTKKDKMKKSFIDILDLSFQEMMQQELADLSIFADEDEILEEEEVEILEPIY